MNSLIRGSLKNPHAVTVFGLALLMLGVLTLRRIPIDILPVFKSPAVQILTFFGGMPAVGMEKSITNRMERGTGMANGVARQESRSIVGVSLVRNYFQPGVDPNGALTEEASLAAWEYPTMPPGTLPPVVLPFDPTSTVPVSLVALDSKKRIRAGLVRCGSIRSPQHGDEQAWSHRAGCVRWQDSRGHDVSGSHADASAPFITVGCHERDGQFQCLLANR